MEKESQLFGNMHFSLSLSEAKMMKYVDILVPLRVVDAASEAKKEYESLTKKMDVHWETETILKIFEDYKQHALNHFDKSTKMEVPLTEARVKKERVYLEHEIKSTTDGLMKIQETRQRVKAKEESEKAIEKVVSKVKKRNDDADPLFLNEFEEMVIEEVGLVLNQLSRKHEQLLGGDFVGEIVFNIMSISAQRCCFVQGKTRKEKEQQKKKKEKEKKKATTRPPLETCSFLISTINHPPSNPLME